MESRGLTSAEAAARLIKFGWNELPSSQRKSIWKIALEVVQEPMFILLLICSALYLLLGDLVEGIILFLSIFVIIAITFYQSRKSERALEELKKLASPLVTVVRDGVQHRIPSRELVPGDVMLIKEGQRVAADARIIDGMNLCMDESILTGESLPVTKFVSSDETSMDSLVFSGTMAVQGYAEALVLCTAGNTRFGQIGASLQAIVPSETRLQRELKSFIKIAFIIGILICIGVIAAYYFSTGQLIKAFLQGLAAPMAILPEEFPVVLTIFLALGAWRLSKKNVLSRRSSAIENLGSATIICTDKTGTLTYNRMEVVAAGDDDSIIHREDPQWNEKASALLQTAIRACRVPATDPMDKAILATSAHAMEARNHWQLIKEYPLRPDFLATANVWKHPDGRTLVFSKGAPETIVHWCVRDPEQRQRIMHQVHQLAAKTYRVLAVASSEISENIPDDPRTLSIAFEGLIALTDPVRKEVPESIRQCQEAGVRILMITGDYPETARSIGRQIFFKDHEHLLTGSEIDQMDKAALAESLKKVGIVARTVPEQKLNIVRALQADGEVVAMTGDGVNDAPALKAADIGIAMGNKGTDVAREASAIILLDDNFSSIVDGIRTGRRIFDNLQKAMSYIMAIHIPIIGLALIPAVIKNIPVLMMPLHIVFLKLVIDPVCSIAFEYEQEEKNVMTRPPRNRDKKFFGPQRIMVSVFKGLLLLLMVISIYLLSVQEGHSEGEARAITFIALITGNIALVLSSLSATRSFISVLKEKNNSALGILFLALAILAVIMAVPALQRIFSFEFPGLRHFMISFAGAFMLLILYESIKLLRRKSSI